MRRHRVLLALALLLVLGLTLSACRPPFERDIEEAQVEAARATEAAQRAQIIAALEPLNPLRYHHLDAIVRNEQRLPADAVIWATRARETLDWVDWPPELQEHVEQYAEWLDSLLSAFRNDDAHAAAEPSRIVHALAHTFEATIEAWLNNDSLPAVPALAGLEPPAHDVHSGTEDDASMRHDDQSEDQMQHEGDDDDHDSHNNHE